MFSLLFFYIRARLGVLGNNIEEVYQVVVLFFMPDETVACRVDTEDYFSFYVLKF